MPAGRPPVLDEACCTTICELVEAGRSLATVARLIGRNVKTIRRHAARDKAFGSRLRAARFNADGQLLKTIRRAAATNSAAAAWLAARPNIQTSQSTLSQRDSEPDADLCRLNGDLSLTVERHN